ncbi:MAG: allophanate hydrolase subunit 1 [Flavobacterium sp.]|nr:MAG: allophanate hydrolase subunit 1 [Flavobacterium sp.]
MKQWKENIFGDRAILIEWPEDLTTDQRREILEMDQFIGENYQEQVLETVPAYNSMAIYLNKGVDVKDFISELNKIEIIPNREKLSSRLVYIPVCYDEEFAPDLNLVASENGLTVQEVIQLHSNGNYRVEFIGFLPGFPYLTGLDRRLFTPRLSNPRPRITAGSIGIGGKQTGVYTMESPGGWNIIGRSPLKFFSVSEETPSLLRPGDLVKFRVIERAEFDLILEQVTRGKYFLKIDNND